MPIDVQLVYVLLIVFFLEGSRLPAMIFSGDSFSSPIIWAPGIPSTWIGCGGRYKRH